MGGDYLDFIEEFDPNCELTDEELEMMYRMYRKNWR